MSPLHRTFTTRKLVFMSLLAAVSVLLVYLIHFPIIPGLAFLEYDPADIAILIGTFLFGTGSGLLLTLVVSVLQGLTVSAQSGWIGILMHVIATGSMVLVAGAIYNRNRTLKRAVVALVAGTLTMTVVMAAWNVLITPLYMGVTRNEVISMLMTGFVPFNLAKAGINSVVTFLVYKPISRLYGVESLQRQEKKVM